MRRRPHLLRVRISISLVQPPRNSALEQPSEILINDKRNARAWKHPDDVRGQTEIKPCDAFVRLGMCDCGWDGTVKGAREHRVVLLTFISSYSCLFCFDPRERRGERRERKGST